MPACFKNYALRPQPAAGNAPRRHRRRGVVHREPHPLRFGAAQGHTLDGPNGLAIQACATISRRLARRIDEHYGEESAYSLEVTSPGADQPLTDPRQYARHIGRSLALKLADGTEKTGTLTAATAEGVEIEEVIKQKTKKTILPAAFYSFGDITEAKVVISFK